MPPKLADLVEPSEQVFAALGRVVFCFGLLEESLRHAIVTALGDPDEGDIIVAGLSFPYLLDRFSLLYAPIEIDDLISGGMRALSIKLSGLNEERNRQIHSTWGFDQYGMPVRAQTRVRRGRGFAFSIESVSPDVLTDLAARMEATTELVYDVRMRFYEYRRANRRDLTSSSEFNAPRS